MRAIALVFDRYLQADRNRARFSRIIRSRRAGVGWTFALTALLMGLAGGPHCIAMCAAPQAGVIRVHPAGQGASCAPGQPWQRSAMFHAGRLLGYAVLGALAGASVQGLGWLATQSAALRPAWTLLHLAVLAWGLVLLVLALARQPAWVQGAGQQLWQRVGPLTRSAYGVGAAGVLWALMPCGLLYSALLVASLSGGPMRGAVSMALFGLGSALSLAAGPWLWRWLRVQGNRVGAVWAAAQANVAATTATASSLGTRAAGGVLAMAALWELWMDFGGRLAAWCGAV